MFRRLLLILLAYTCVTGAFAQSLRVGVSPDYPPLAYLQDGSVVGIEADNARAVGEILSKKMVLVQSLESHLPPS